MNKSRAEVVAELTDVGEPPGEELNYRTISGAVEAVGCMFVEQLPENIEGHLALTRLREALFWARRSLGRAHVMERAGIEHVDGMNGTLMEEGVDNGSGA